MDFISLYEKKLNGAKDYQNNKFRAIKFICDKDREAKNEIAKLQGEIIKYRTRNNNTEINLICDIAYNALGTLFNRVDDISNNKLKEYINES